MNYPVFQRRGGEAEDVRGLTALVGAVVRRAESEGKDPVQEVAAAFADPAIGQPDLEAAAWWVAAFKEAVASG